MYAVQNVVVGSAYGVAAKDKRKRGNEGMLMHVYSAATIAATVPIAPEPMTTANGAIVGATMLSIPTPLKTATTIPSMIVTLRFRLRSNFASGAWSSVGVFVGVDTCFTS